MAAPTMNLVSGLAGRTIPDSALRVRKYTPLLKIAFLSLGMIIVLTLNC